LIWSESMGIKKTAQGCSPARLWFVGDGDQATATMWFYQLSTLMGIGLSLFSDHSEVIVTPASSAHEKTRIAAGCLINYFTGDQLESCDIYRLMSAILSTTLSPLTSMHCFFLLMTTPVFGSVLCGREAWFRMYPACAFTSRIES
jgi:hypothetical protein